LLARQSLWHGPCSSHPSPVSTPSAWSPTPGSRVSMPSHHQGRACSSQGCADGTPGHQGMRAPLRPQPTAEAPASSSTPHTHSTPPLLPPLLSPLVPMGTHGVAPSVRPSPPPMPLPLLPSPSDRFPARPGPACPHQPACRAATGIAVAGDMAGDAPWGEAWWGGGGGGLTICGRGAWGRQVVTTPGVGFGPAGQGFIRISAFGHRENVIEACTRFRTAFKK
jgi:hypothetical protein